MGVGSLVLWDKLRPLDLVVSSNHMLSHLTDPNLSNRSQVITAVILAVWRLKQEGQGFKASLSCIKPGPPGPHSEIESEIYKASGIGL